MSKQMGLAMSTILSLTIGLVKQGLGCLYVASVGLAGSGGTRGPAAGSDSPATTSVGIGTASGGSFTT